jgi:hypothetical protein
VRLVSTSAVSYSALVGMLFWQALRGQPLLSKDVGSIVVLLSWLALTALFTWRSLVAPALPGRAAISVS